MLAVVVPEIDAPHFSVVVTRPRLPCNSFPGLRALLFPPRAGEGGMGTNLSWRFLHGFAKSPLTLPSQRMRGEGNISVAQRVSACRLLLPPLAGEGWDGVPW